MADRPQDRKRPHRDKPGGTVKGDAAAVAEEAWKRWRENGRDWNILYDAGVVQRPG